MYQILWLFLIAVTAHACGINGNVYNLTSSFIDIAPPGTLTIVETYTFAGTGCTYTITALQTIEVGGSAYYAPPELLTSQASPLTVTYRYDSLTLTTLLSAGPTIETWIGGVGGGGSETIVLPTQSLTGFTKTQTNVASTTSTSSSFSTNRVSTTSALSSSPTEVTLTITSSVHSSRATGGVTTAEIGGIVGGILGGFLILSGALIFVFRRKTPTLEAAPPAEQMREQETSSNFDDITETPYVVRAPPPTTNLRYPDEYYEAGARVKN